VRARNALAQELASKGRTEVARETRKLQRATVPAWIVNQLAHHHPERIAELLASARALEQAHRRTLSGLGPELLKEANRAFQRALDTLVSEASATLTATGRAASGEPLRLVEETLRAAALGAPEERTALSQGMLTRPLRLAGFGELSPLQLVGPAPQARTRARSTAQPASRRPARELKQAEPEPPPRGGVVLRGPWLPRHVEAEAPPRTLQAPPKRQAQARSEAQTRRRRAEELERHRRAEEQERQRREARQQVKRAERDEQRARRGVERAETALAAAEARTQQVREALERAVEAERKRAEALTRARMQLRSAELALAQARRSLQEAESRQPR
jgi:hypothetical protein